jgi:purine-binding chemotaxis protein CheW
MIDWEATRNRLRASETALARALAVDQRRLEEVLRQRAEQLATRGREQATEELLPVLVFRLGKERYALELSYVAEVLPLARCVAVPGGPQELTGLIPVRGEICNVLDLAALLGLPDSRERAGGYVVLLRGARRQIGLRVDEVDRVDTIGAHALAGRVGVQASACSSLKAELQLAHVQGVLPDGLALLNVDAILSHPLLGEV